jgi:AraC family transcriptional regulator
VDGKSENSYAQRIGKVCDYIGAHLDEDLSVEKLSRIAHFSKYHFHRQFSEYTGINVARFILMMRLKRASYQLVFNKRARITDIALDAGFENPESFSRAFKNTFGQTPSQFRQHPAWLPWHAQYQTPTLARNPNMNIQLVEFATTKVAVLEHRGAPELLNDSVSIFIEWRKASKLSPVATSLTLGVAYDDPKATAPENFRFDICGSIDADVPANAQGVVTRLIPGGRCALVRHLGSRDAMDEKVHYLYGKWLPASGEELRDFPCFFHYVNLFPEVPEHELITDIYLPLK